MNYIFLTNVQSTLYSRVTYIACPLTYLTAEIQFLINFWFPSTRTLQLGPFINTKVNTELNIKYFQIDRPPTLYV